VPSFDRSAFVGFRFPPEVIVLAVRWYLRFGLSYRDLEELLAERGVDVDHVTLFRWVQRFTPLLIDAARPCRHVVGRRWFVDETYVKVAGIWRYVYRAIDEHDQVIDVLVSKRRDISAARAFFTSAVLAHDDPDEVITDRAAALAYVIAELLPDARHNTKQYANNRIECDHRRLKARLRPMRGLKTDRTASIIIHGHAFVQNLRRGHYELGADAMCAQLRVAAAFDELAPRSDRTQRSWFLHTQDRPTQQCRVQSIDAMPILLPGPGAGPPRVAGPLGAGGRDTQSRINPFIFFAVGSTSVCVYQRVTV
jgi:IS6 family transposase